eukprot:sb/3475058/
MYTKKQGHVIGYQPIRDQYFARIVSTRYTVGPRFSDILGERVFGKFILSLNRGITKSGATKSGSDCTQFETRIQKKKIFPLSINANGYDRPKTNEISWRERWPTYTFATAGYHYELSFSPLVPQSLIFRA